VKAAARRLAKKRASAAENQHVKKEPPIQW
jgi:hypothetical protein